MKPTILSLENRISTLRGRTGRENGKSFANFSANCVS